MTPADTTRAVKLYQKYKTDTAEYRGLAERNGMTTAGLNSMCWRILRQRVESKALARAAIAKALGK